MTIKITDTRAIVVNDTNYALAKWKNKKMSKNGPDNWVWSEYMWCTTMDNAIRRLAQELLSDMDQTVTMTEFKAYFQDAFEQIKKAIDEAGS